MLIKFFTAGLVACLTLGFGCRERFSVHYSPGSIYEYADDEIAGQTSAHLPPRSWPYVGSAGMAVTQNYLASEAAVKTLAEGGNAIDAMVAAKWTLSVVTPHLTGLGGEMAVLYYSAETGQVTYYDGLAHKPKAMDVEDWYKKRANKEGKRFQQIRMHRISGGLPVAVPGMVKLLFHLKEKHGNPSMDMAQTAAWAKMYARFGFKISPDLQRGIHSQYERLQQFRTSDDIYFPRHKIPHNGTVIAQVDLGDTIDELTQQGPEFFYEGELAEDIVDAVKASQFPGRLTLEDLKAYSVRELEPLKINMGGRTIFTAPAPASGLVLAQTLGLSELFTKRFKLGPQKFKVHQLPAMHLFLEATKLSYADRDIYLTHVKPQHPWQPEALLDSAYLEERTSFTDIDVAEKAPVEAGFIPGYGGQTKVEDIRADEGGGSTTVIIVDKAGNWVVAASGLNHKFGSAEVISDRGFVLNSSGGMLAKERLLPSTPLAGQLRRIRSNLTPVLVTDKKGRPQFSLGGSYERITSGEMAKVLIHKLWNKADLQTAINAPRFVHDNKKFAKGEMLLLRQEDFIKSMRKYDQKFLRSTNLFNQNHGPLHGLQRAERGTFQGIADLRGEGGALAVVPCLVKAVCRGSKSLPGPKGP